MLAIPACYAGFGAAGVSAKLLFLVQCELTYNADVSVRHWLPLIIHRFKTLTTVNTSDNAVSLKIHTSHVRWILKRKGVSNPSVRNNFPFKGNARVIEVDRLENQSDSRSRTGGPWIQLNNPLWFEQVSLVGLNMNWRAWLVSAW